MALHLELLLAYALGLAALYFVGWLLLVPFKFLSRLLLNAFFGGVVLLALDLMSQALHLTIAVNGITALCAGVLGVPGAVLVALLPLVL